MNAILKGMVAVAAVATAAGAGLWAGQRGLVKLPIAAAPHAPATTSADREQSHAAGQASQVPAAAKAAPGKAAQGERKIIHYRNPMGLPDISPVPKKDSMGMDYIPVYEDEVDEGDTVRVSPSKVQRTGVKTETVSKRAVVRNIRAPGVVEIDERHVAVVAPRFDGFIEKVGPVTSGVHVKKGEPLMAVFGQELLNQAARLLVEQDYGASSDELSTPRSRRVQPAGVVGARRRLHNFGVPEAFIEQIKRTRTVPDTVSWPAPLDGVVLERNAVDGQGFKAGDVLFRIADLSVVWVMADVAEGDIGALKPGQSVKVTTRAHPGRTFTGKVAVVYPQLMKNTRTVRVRVELPNHDFALLPDMYADVDIFTGDDQPTITVPESAVIDSGKRQVVILDRGEGKFEPREVKLGRRGNGYVGVISGLEGGETIVVNGNFLIDAESNLQSALKGLTPPSAHEAHR